MTTPHATQISRAIGQRLEQIRLANGYLTDLGLRIYRGRAALYQDQTTRPYACLISARDDVDYESRRRVKASRVYDLVVTLTAGADYDEQQDALLHDIRRALSKDSQASVLDGLALDMVLGGAQLDNPDLGSNAAQITMTITALYAETY